MAGDLFCMLLQWKVYVTRYKFVEFAGPRMAVAFDVVIGPLCLRVDSSVVTSVSLSC